MKYIKQKLMKYSLFIILLFLGIGLYSQGIIPPERKISPVSGAFPGAKIPVSVSGIKVIQTCPDSLTLGYVPAGSGNETSKLVARDNKGNWLNALMNQRYSSNFVANGSRILWLIKDLSLTTDTSGNYYFTHVWADVFKGTVGKSYQKILSIDTVLTGNTNDSSGYATGLTRALDELYITSLTDLYNESQGNVQQLASRMAEPLQTEDLLKAKVLSEYALPILMDTIYKGGAYANFSEFIHNTPSITGSIWAQPDTLSGSGHVKIFVLGQDSTAIQLSSIWGVCFGGSELYVYEKGQLLPIEKAGNGFVLSRYQEPVIRKNQALYWRRVISNRWPENANPFDRGKMLTVSENKQVRNLSSAQQPVATRIDMLTGTMTF